MPRQTKAQAEAAAAEEAKATEAAAAETAPVAPVEADAVTEVEAPAEAPADAPEPTDHDAQRELADVQAAAVVAAVPEENPADPAPETEGQSETPQPTRAGTVEVKVLQDAFNWIDEHGFYQTVGKGEVAKVTAAQADRGEELGAVERV